MASYPPQASYPTQMAGPASPQEFYTGPPELRNDETIPVHGPLAAAATTYHYTQQHDVRIMHAEYKSRSQLAAMCGKPTHKVMVMIWDELFWVLSMPLLLATTLINGALRFVLEGVVRPLVLGPIQLLGDHLIKPLSVVQFDAFVLPAVTLMANTLGALVLVVQPIAQILDLLVRPLATLLSSCRLVQISYGLQPPPMATTSPVQQV